MDMDLLIKQACELLSGKIRNTPIEYSPGLSTLAGHSIYLKLECLQTTGSFKLRGAYFYLSMLDEGEIKRGVAACSAGNHGLGVAYAAREMGIPCTVFVPKSVDQAKHAKLLKLGAEVHKSDSLGYDDTYEWAVKEAAKLQIPMVPAYDDERIMAGNGGTLAVEVLAQAPDAAHIILPMGGGGLAGGFAWQAKAQNPSAKITVCQLAECPALKLSLEQGKAVTYLPPIETLAGGLEGGLGAKCFDILKDRVDEIALITEEELQAALCWMLEQHQYLIEPSAAVALATCLFGKTQLKGPAVVILTGRNVSYATVQQILCRKR